MRKFKRRQRHSLPFGLFLAVVGALLLLAAFAPSANADLIAYFNFEDPTVNGQPDFTGEGNLAFFGVGSPNGDRPITTNYLPANMATVGSTSTINKFPGDPDPSLSAMGLTSSRSNSTANFDINLSTPQGFFSAMTVSFAINAQGNGFTLADIQFSTNGTTFTSAGTTVLPNSGTIVVSATLPSAANNATTLIVRIALSGGQSNGGDLQNVVDNIRIEGAVPEPATVAGGLLGVVGLCWFQRRRLMGSVRFRRT